MYLNETALKSKSHTHSVSKQITIFIFFCDNFSNCKPIQIIFGRNIALKIWNKVTHGNFDTYSIRYASVVYIVK